MFWVRFDLLAAKLKDYADWTKNWGVLINGISTEQTKEKKWISYVEGERDISRIINDCVLLKKDIYFDSQRIGFVWFDNDLNAKWNQIWQMRSGHWFR